MFMFQFKIFGVSIEIMCAQNNVRQTAFVVRRSKKNKLTQRLPHSQSHPARRGRAARGEARRAKPAKTSALTETRDTRRFGREDFLNDILKLVLAKRL
jgi:hypothetical protein